MRDNIKQQKDPHLSKIVEFIRESVDPEKIALFGSRARGDANEKSDYDIAVFRPFSDKKWSKMILDIEEEIPILKKFDILDFEKLDEKFKARILKEAKTLYEKK